MSQAKITQKQNNNFRRQSGIHIVNVSAVSLANMVSLTLFLFPSWFWIHCLMAML